MQLCFVLNYRMIAEIIAMNCQKIAQSAIVKLISSARTTDVYQSKQPISYCNHSFFSSEFILTVLFFYQFFRQWTWYVLIKIETNNLKSMNLYSFNFFPIPNFSHFIVFSRFCFIFISNLIKCGFKK